MIPKRQTFLNYEIVEDLDTITAGNTRHLEGQTAYNPGKKESLIFLFQSL